MSNLPNGVQLTEGEKAVMRLAAIAWSGGRGPEESLYAEVEAIVQERLRKATPVRVCANCGTAWKADVHACPTCSEPEEEPMTESSERAAAEVGL